MNIIKKILYKLKVEQLTNKGFVDGTIVPFDEELYAKLSKHFVSGLPISMHIRFLRPALPPYKCYDRSVYMFYCLDDVVLVRGDIKPLEVTFGKESAGHGWVEDDKYVYDPSTLLRYEKDLYYKINEVSNVKKYTVEDDLAMEETKKLYKSIKNSSIDDYKVNGKNRFDLIMSIPLVKAIAEQTCNHDFIKAVDSFIKETEYDEEEIFKQINTEYKKRVLNK